MTMIETIRMRVVAVCGILMMLAGCASSSGQRFYEVAGYFTVGRNPLKPYAGEKT